MVVSGLEVVRKLFLLKILKEIIFLLKTSLPNVSTFSTCFGWMYHIYRHMNTHIYTHTCICIYTHTYTYISGW